MITFSAPGKIHLLGEHTVVYGKPALLTSIDKRIFVTLSPTTKINQIDPQLIPLKDALENAIKQKFGIKKIPNYSMEIKSEIPIGSGHGSSAALSAAFSGALLSLLKIDWTLELVNEIAYEGERYFHGNPSGGDVAAVTFGGFLWFRKELEIVKLIHPIKQKIHSSVKQFFIINSGKPVETTKEMVEKVAVLKTKNQVKIKRILDEQEELTKILLMALVDGNHQHIMTSIHHGERNLEALGVVGKKAKEMIAKIEDLGGACKIIGGGGFKEGSGMLLAYHTDPKKMSVLISKNAWDSFAVTLGTEGLKQEN